MLKEYWLDAEDEKIISELDDLCGVVQNKDVLKDIITCSKLKEAGKINFNNNNIIIRNYSDYNIMDDFLKVCSKLFLKYKLIENNQICYMDKFVNDRKERPLDRIVGIDDGIIVINDRNVRIDYKKEYDYVAKLVNTYKNKIFIFEDENFCEGRTDAELGDLVTWRMTIEKISLEDKVVYCQNILDKNDLKYKRSELKEFADKPFWELKNELRKIIIDTKANGFDTINVEVFKKQQKNREKELSKRGILKNDKNDKENMNAKEELNKLVGLTEIKKQTEKILNYVKLNKARGKMPMLHMCFNGNPGTGKTSIARIIGKLFDEEKILPGNGEFMEIHGRDLVDKYVGWTAQKVHETVEKAIGGVLFIDEAYSLVTDRRGSFEDEAIATLIKEMEDHRDEICIILAGYTKEMENLIKANPGFESRIQFTMDFPDYSENELIDIFEGLCKSEDYKLGKNCKELLLENFKTAKKQEGFGNGRYVRNIFEKVKFEQADRIVKLDCKNVNLITLKDVENAFENSKRKINKKRVIGF